jgi:hypothetical protein
VQDLETCTPEAFGEYAAELIAGSDMWGVGVGREGFVVLSVAVPVRVDDDNTQRKVVSTVLLSSQHEPSQSVSNCTLL